jgi:hypothetical protein
MSSVLSSAILRSRRPARAAALWAIFAAAVFFATQVLAAQQAPAPPNSPAAATAKKSPRHRPRPTEVQAPAPENQAAPSPEPEAPKWPVNDAPSKPDVTWDSTGLKIEANNASLHDILNEVAADTGAKVEGMGSDERVFGEYGPGNTRDVISQLLHGSSYNVLMIGDQGAGTPRQIVLSTRRAGANQPQANRNMPQDQPDEDIPDQPEDNDQSGQQPIINGRPPMPMVPQGPPGIQPGPPGAPRTPQQVLQELQQRQQQIQDMQQQQQQQQH